jgi:Protein of unknown function (DUF2442)/Domain of unknown function (DUF4160)
MEAQVRIAPVGLLDGELPPRALALVVEWASLHRVELAENWRRLHADERPVEIAPLEEPMNPRIAHVRVPAPYRVQLTFTDGTSGTVDLAPWIEGRRGVFAALQDLAFFATVSVDQDAGTIVWPNGADLDPDVLYEAAHGTAAPVKQAQG